MDAISKVVGQKNLMSKKIADRSSAAVTKTSMPTCGVPVAKYAAKVLELIMQRPSVEAIIGTRDQGKFLISSLPDDEAFDKQSSITGLTEKSKVLIRKLLNEDLEQVRIKGTTCEVIVTYDDDLEIITIQSNLDAK